MSNHHILTTVSQRVRSLLWAGIKADDTARSLVVSENAIKIGPPSAEFPDGRLYIWLYQIRPNRYKADLPMHHVTDVAEPQPLPLDLWYMITPVMPEGEQDGSELVLLALTLQVMAAHARITISGPGCEENLRVILEDPPVQEQVLLWRALRKPMHLAVFYQLTTVRIDPWNDIPAVG